MTEPTTTEEVAGRLRQYYAAAIGLIEQSALDQLSAFVRVEGPFEEDGSYGVSLVQAPGIVGGGMTIREAAEALVDATEAWVEARIAEEAAGLRSTFDLRWKADMRAIKRWQAAHPGRPNVWPDHADLVVWLLDELDRAESHNGEDYRVREGDDQQEIRGY